MTRTLQRLRPLLIGLVVLLLTAGIALAGKPSAAPDGLTVAGEAAGQAVPVQAGADEQEEQDEQDEGDEGDQDEAVPDADTDEDGGENCATDPTGLTVEALAELKHGSIVCWAAHQATPAGYDNHGQWVSEWAKQNHGHAGDSGESGLPGAASEHAGKGKANKP